MIQNINIGTTANDKTGDPARLAGQKINANFQYLEEKINNQTFLAKETGFTLLNQELTMNAAWEWTINNIGYTNPVAVVVAIPLAASGLSRIDLIVCTTSNTFLRVAGVESALTPMAPALPANTVMATFFTTTSGSVGTPVIVRPKGEVTSVNGLKGEVVLTKADLGLANVTNTSDANKPVSIAQQAAIDLKLNASSYNQHFRGVYLTELALNTALPTANVGDYAQVNVVGATDVVNYNWDAEENIWVINAVASSGALNTDQLPEGSTNLYWTVARFLTNLTLANIVAALGYTPSTAPNDAQKNSDITKAEIEAKLTGEIATHTHPAVGSGSTKKTQIITGEMATTNVSNVEYISGDISSDWLSRVGIMPVSGDTINGASFDLYSDFQTKIIGFNSVIKSIYFRFKTDGNAAGGIPNFNIIIHAFVQNPTGNIINARRIFSQNFTGKHYQTQVKKFVTTDVLLPNLLENEQIIMTFKSNQSDTFTIRHFQTLIVLEEV